MRELMFILKALADENRVRALKALDGRELCVCQLVELLDLANSTVSKHMAILNQAGLVVSRKEGRWVYYRLPDETGSPLARIAIQWLLTTMDEVGIAEADMTRLEEILCCEKEALCKMQAARK